MLWILINWMALALFFGVDLMCNKFSEIYNWCMRLVLRNFWDHHTRHGWNPVYLIRVQALSLTTWKDKDLKFVHFKISDFSISKTILKQIEITRIRLDD